MESLFGDKISLNRVTNKQSEKNASALGFMMDAISRRLYYDAAYTAINDGF